MDAIRRLSLVTVFLLMSIFIAACGQQAATPPPPNTQNPAETGKTVNPPADTTVAGGNVQATPNGGTVNAGAGGNVQSQPNPGVANTNGNVQATPNANPGTAATGGNVQATPNANPAIMGANGNVQATPNAGIMNAGAGNNTQGPANGGATGKQQAFIHTAEVQINGRMVHVLTNSGGFLLYYSMSDTRLASNCTGQCAQAWPPLLILPGTTTITSSIPLPRQLSIHKTANGDQVFYDCHALYTSSLDKQAGQLNGRGQNNNWYLVGFLL